jgi:cullin-4
LYFRLGLSAFPPKKPVMPPKKPVIIKLKTPAAVDPTFPARCWEQVSASLDAIFEVPVSAAPSKTNGAHAEVGSSVAKDAALEAATSNIADGIRRRELIIHRRIGHVVSFHRVYQAANDLCRVNPPDMLDKIRSAFEKWIPKGVSAWLTPLIAVEGDDDDGHRSPSQAPAVDAQTCMRQLVAAWEHHFAALKVVVDIVAFLENSYAKLNSREGGIIKIGTKLFSQAATSPPFDVAFKAACSGFVEAVAEDRAGNSIRRSDLASCRSLLEATESYLCVEAPLAADADKYYTRLGNTVVYAERVTARDFIRRVEHEMAAEDVRLRSYGHPSVRARIEQLLQERLIKAHLQHITNENMRTLVQNKDLAVLSGLHRLSRLRYVRQEDIIRKAFREYVAKTTTDIINSPPEMEDAVIELLVAHNNTVSEVIQKCFAVGSTGTDAFTSAKKDAFESALRVKQHKAAELLAKYLDMILREGANALNGGSSSSSLAAASTGDTSDQAASVMNGAQASADTGMTPSEAIDAALTEAMKLFSFIPSKDVFEAFYTRYFGKRLILQRSVGLEHERVVIEHLKAICGPSVAVKLNGMLKDIDISREIQSCGFDFNILVLTEGYWPTYTTVQPALPDKIARQIEVFKVFYHSRYSGRKLTWQHALSHCVVKGVFPKAKKELVVSFLQALILLEFNNTTAITYGELLQHLNVEPSEELTCAIIGLYAGNAKVLLREKAEGLPPLPKQKAGAPRVVVRNEDVIRYNDKFVHRLVKIRVNQVQLRETKEEVQETTEKVLAERHFIVDAAIVRFMKSRKEAKHNELVSEVIGMLRFQAQPPDIKKRIEHLIEREYLERDGTDNSLYRYLA